MWVIPGQVNHSQIYSKLDTYIIQPQPSLVLFVLCQSCWPTFCYNIILGKDYFYIIQSCSILNAFFMICWKRVFNYAGIKGH